MSTTTVPQHTPAFRKALANWNANGHMKFSLPPSEWTGYRVALVCLGWVKVAEWLDEAGSDYLEGCEEFTPDEAAYAHIADRCNYYEHAWVDGSLVILVED